MQEFDPATRMFVRGELNSLIDADGHRVFDAVSSIWTTIHGHCHPYIVERIAKQAAVLDHATLLGASNPPAEVLASRLCTLSGLDFAFFSGDGASAVEVALKMALQFWQHTGAPQRTRFVRLVSSYHGDTAGAMSISDIEVFKSRFGAVTFESIPFDDAATVLARDDVAAIVVEPLVQAAAGIRLIPPAFYDPLNARSSILIVDEIATGFGRTGTMFAYEQLNLTPDIVCLGKGLTGGTMALSATLVSRKIHDAFLGSREEVKQLFHGHSFAGNPIACAAALASIELFRLEETLAKSQGMSAVLKTALAQLRALDAVTEIRGIGMMHAVEVDPHHAHAHTVVDELYRRGFFTRAIGNAIQCVPPLSSTVGEIMSFAAALGDILAA